MDLCIDNAPVPDHKVVNFMGAHNYKLSPLLRLKVITASWIRGEPQYYRKATYVQHELTQSLDDILICESANNILDSAISDALEDDFLGVLEWAVKLRTEFYMRTSPQIILVEAAMHKNRPEFNKSNPNVFRSIAKKITILPTDLDYQRKYYIEKNGSISRLPNILKRCWAECLESFNEYQIGKYAKKGHIIDCAKLSHAKSSANSALDTLMKTGKLHLTGEAQTWEGLRSAGKSWSEICNILGDLFPHMALLRNLRNFVQNLPHNEMLKVLQLLVKGVPNGKQFPFRYYTAYTQLNNNVATSTNNDRIIYKPSKRDPAWKWAQYNKLQHNDNIKQLVDVDVPLDVNVVNLNVQVAKEFLEKCLQVSMNNFPQLDGRVVCLSDNSGSAWGTITSEYGSQTVATIGNLSALITALRATGGGQVGVFGDKLLMYDVDKNRGVLEQLDEINNLGQLVGAATENGIWLWFKQAFQNRNDKSVNHLFIYSDMQAGHGGLYGCNAADYKDYAYKHTYIDVIKLIKKYRELVNPRINIFTVQTGGYDNSLVPEVGRRMVILAGWTGKEVSYASAMINNWDCIGF